MLDFDRQSAMARTVIAVMFFGLLFLLFPSILFCSAAKYAGTQTGHVKNDNSSLNAESEVYCSDSLSPHTNFPVSKSGTHGVVSLPLMHFYGKFSPFRPPNSSWSSLLLQSVKNDEHRFRFLKSSIAVLQPARFNPQEDTDEPVASGNNFNTGNYITKIGVGTPAQSLYTVIDTGSDITWIPCNPCSNCQSKASPPFDASKSSSYESLSCASPPCVQLGSDPNCGNFSCDFTGSYGDGSQYGAVLSSDTLTLTANSISGFYFGCAHALVGLIQREPGLIGLGRAALSLPSQTANLFEKTFSYCLPSLLSSKFSGSLHLGKGALSAPGLKSTALLQNPAQPSFYYVGLMGISVGGQPVSIPPGTFALDKSNGGGTIIDSGTVITRLVNPAYTALRDAFRAKLSNLTNGAAPTSLSIFDTCYNISADGIDGASILITLHFDDGLNLSLPKGNILTPPLQGPGFCLAFAVPPQGSFSGLSIIGNFQQQNVRVVYDTTNSQIGFAEENCSA